MGRHQHHRRRNRRASAHSQIKSRSRRGNCRISAEQGCVLMRILSLTSAIEKKLLAERRSSTRDAARVAARIVQDVRRRGDAALFSWTKSLDRIALNSRSVWVSRAELKNARKNVSREFLAAI